MEAIADSGWHFSEWTGDNSTVTDTGANDTTITIEGDYTIKRNVFPPYDGYELSTLVTSGEVVYIGHIGGVNDEDGDVLTTTKEQVEQTLKNLEEYLGEVEMDLQNVVKLTVILKDIDDFKDMHIVWKRYFGEGEYPARTVITSEFVNDDILVQVEGTACYDR